MTDRACSNRSDQPGKLRRFWHWWLRTAEVIGNFQSRVVLTLFYALIVMPFGLAVRLFSDRLRIRGTRSSGWTDFVARCSTLDRVRQQY